MGEQKTCPACGCKFEHIEGPSGAAIPVQKVKVVYALESSAPRLTKLTLASPHVSAYYVSHFETCSDPGRFSKGGRRGQRSEGG